MKGSEKQIKWAEEIKANVVKTVTQGIDKLAPYVENGNEKQKDLAEKSIAIYQNWLSNLNNAENAADIIDALAGVRFTGIFEQDFMAVKSHYRCGLVSTPAAKAILGRN